MTLSHRHVRRATAVGIASIGLVLASGTAAFASADSVTNGSFQEPGANNVTPADWTATNFGNESSPYSASIDTYDVNGAYPPPAGTPGGDTVGNFAVENYYPHANMTSYWKNISLVPGGPNTALPESPLTLGLALVGAAVIAVAVGLSRRKRTAA